MNVWILKKASGNTHKSKQEREIIKVPCNLLTIKRKISQELSSKMAGSIIILW